jgi:hypothetical protein
MRGELREQLRSLTTTLIVEGVALERSIPARRDSAPVVDARGFARFRAGCQTLLHLLGQHGAHWQPAFAVCEPTAQAARVMIGTLEAIREAVERDWLVTIETLVVAETYSNLIEQAEYLLAQNYTLAAGVVGRAVLEDHLRTWCEKACCPPDRSDPSLYDFKTSLYTVGALNKLEMKHVDSMAAIGNDAAHGKPDLRREDVERLVRDVREFVTRNAVR